MHTDHPHAGGDNNLFLYDCRYAFGPSPRGWGQPRLDAANQGILRTIPTRVGTTIAYQKDAVANADHPHAGGDNLTTGQESNNWFGPSPRGWGQRPGVLAGELVIRTIPTRVGTTLDYQRLT